MEEIKQFRNIFKPTMSEVKYEGSYMLNAPYEEVVHYLEQAITKAREEGYKKGYDQCANDGKDFYMSHREEAREEERESIIKWLEEQLEGMNAEVGRIEDGARIALKSTIDHLKSLKQ